MLDIKGLFEMESFLTKIIQIPGITNTKQIQSMTLRC
jgi:hypothetical protein